MGWIIALIVGGIAGWLASLLMNRDGSMGVFWNIVVGCVGSVIGNALAGPLFGVRGSVQEFSLTGLNVSSPTTSSTRAVSMPVAAMRSSAAIGSLASAM